MKLIFIGPSGAGKTTFAEYLLTTKNLPYRFAKAVSDCTRKPRDGEVEGDAYYFITESEFKRRETANKYVETTLYNGSYRGLRKDELAEKEAGGNIVIVVMDIHGALAMKEIYGDEVANVFLEVPKDVLEQRMRDRGDSEEAIKSRLDNYESTNEGENGKYCDFAIVNDCSFEELSKRLIDGLKGKGLA